MLLDVTFGGYRLVPLERFLKNGNEIVHKITIKHDVSNGIKKVGRWLDVPYDYKGLLSFINPLNRIFKKTLIDPTENPNSLICSEMVIVMLQTSDYPNAHMLIAHKTSPKQLYEFVLVNELL